MLIMACAAAWVSVLEAQTLPPSNGESSADTRPATRAGRFFDAEDGMFDVSSFLEDPRGFLPIPIVVTEPAVGYGGGAVGMFLRPRPEAGSEGWARPNIAAVGGLATENGTWAAFAGDTSRWLDGRLRTLAGGGTGNINLDFFGFGAGRADINRAVRYSLQFSGAVAQVNWQLEPRSPWAVGVRYVYANVDPKLREEPIFPGLADRARVTVSAPTAILEYDTRDNVFTPTRGVYAESAYLVSRETLGATTDFERFDQIFMAWKTLPHDVTLGARVNYARASGGTPFFLRPFVALRGVPDVRYQGDETISLELEGRWQFQGRWSVVAFGGAGRSWSRGQAVSFTQGIGAGGAGFRYELARKFGMHVGVDVAHSPGTTAFYFIVGNAWFRP
ncbi:MAG TPA: glyceraldehyde-3-phosphate dehydrogenase [Casimicrobiaceae bacterium]|nr:glyceraldehyde-3-phosphate dehydrogenase [Casimicrobiaceae bacterium]